MYNSTTTVLQQHVQQYYNSMYNSYTTVCKTVLQQFYNSITTVRQSYRETCLYCFLFISVRLSQPFVTVNYTLNDIRLSSMSVMWPLVTLFDHVVQCRRHISQKSIEHVLDTWLSRSWHQELLFWLSQSFCLWVLISFILSFMWYYQYIHIFYYRW